MNDSEISSDLAEKAEKKILYEKMAYFTSTEGLSSLNKDNIVPVFLNITKDNAVNRAAVDKDGHQLHIHIPHEVLEKMAKSGQDHVLHINI